MDHGKNSLNFILAICWLSFLAWNLHEFDKKNIGDKNPKFIPSSK